MSSTYLNLNYHLIFSTKHREQTIEKSWQARLHEYMGGIIRGLGGVSLEVGGIADHVHLLIRLKATHTLANVLRDLKKSSSGWIHQEVGVRRFAWQEGYAAFTVGATS